MYYFKSAIDFINIYGKYNLAANLFIRYLPLFSVRNIDTNPLNIVSFFLMKTCPFDRNKKGCPVSKGVDGVFFILKTVRIQYILSLRLGVMH